MLLSTSDIGMTTPRRQDKFKIQELSIHFENFDNFDIWTSVTEVQPFFQKKQQNISIHIGFLKKWQVVIDGQDRFK